MTRNLNEPKTKLMTVRLTEEQFDHFKEMANSHSMTLSSLVIEAVELYGRVKQLKEP